MVPTPVKRNPAEILLHSGAEAGCFERTAEEAQRDNAGEVARLIRARYDFA
jgi:hypothetical protein